MKFFIRYFLIALMAAAAAQADPRHHKTIEAPAPYPELEAVVEKDARSGYHLAIRTANFRFAPEQINQAPSPGEGHARIYLNGAKFRQYSPYFHLAPRLLKTGENTVRVTLNASNHAELAIDGRPTAQIVTVQQ